MSRAQLDKFIDLVSNDPAAWQEASKDEEDAQKFVRNVVQYAKGRGYDFTEDEAKAWMIESSQQSADGELKDSQLDAVAGGIIVVNNRGLRMPNLGALLPAIKPGALGHIKAGLGVPPDDS